MKWLACSLLVQTISIVDTSRLPLIEAKQHRSTFRFPCVFLPDLVIICC